jgi:hypothetical protein
MSSDPIIIIITDLLFNTFSFRNFSSSGSLQDNSEFLGKPFLRNALQVIPGMT